MFVRVPGSSANLGPGFDALGMALDLTADVGLINGSVPADARAADAHHPADVAFRRMGGTGDIWVRSRLPMGRGLGYSGAVRVGGLVLAAAQRSEDCDLPMDEVLRHASELEGHADNVAASLHGGVVVAAGARVVRVPVAFDASVVVWIPSFTTSTDASRGRLPETVSLADAAFNVARSSLLVAALVAGDVESLREATLDRLHQPHRLSASPQSAAAVTAALDAGAWAAWLSGSGPSVAALCAPAQAAAIAGSLPADGQAKVLAIAAQGATVHGR